MTPITLTRAIERRNAKGEVIDRVTELTPREPELGDLLDALGAGVGADGKMQVGDMLGFVGARIFGISAAELRRLNMRDSLEVAMATKGFLPPGLIDGLTGLRSSPGRSASPPTIDAGAPESFGSGPAAPPGSSAAG